TGLAPAGGAARGGYVLADAGADIGGLRGILLPTVSEIRIALAARDMLQADGIGTRVVSLPCLEWFAAQDPAYRDEVLPPGTAARGSGEAGGAGGGGGGGGAARG